MLQAPELIAALAVGEDADAVIFGPARKLFFSSNGESCKMTVIRGAAPSGYTTIQTLTSKPSARTIAVDPSSGAVYTVSTALAGAKCLRK